MIERAKKLIDDFCFAEYGAEADFSDLKRVPIAYTVIGDSEIQVFVNLIDYSVIREVNGEIVSVSKFDTLSNLIENELEYLDFEVLIAI